MNTSPISLFQVAKDGGIQVWRISVRNWDILIEYGRLGGVMQTQVENVPHGKAGRSRREQVLSRVKSRINKQLDRGYKKTIEEARAMVGRDASGNIKPMLAHPLKRISYIDWKTAYVQPKYDGHRMLVEITEKGVRGWSRLGKEITSVQHIFDALCHLPIGTVLDGELYHHGTPLQTIASWIKRYQKESSNLKYIVFDMVDTDRPFRERICRLEEILKSRPYHIDIAPTQAIKDHEELNYFTNLFIEQGYEGAILRHSMLGYEIGRRSNSLVKVKKFLDAEFECVDIKESRDGWAVLTLKTDSGKLFGASAPGSIAEKEAVLKEPQKYIGRKVTVEYSQLTVDGVPFHPVAIRWREDI